MIVRCGNKLFYNASPNLACSLLGRPLNRVIRTSSKDGGEDLSKVAASLRATDTFPRFASNVPLKRLTLDHLL